MPETRYKELLDLPEEIQDPDYYQLLGIDRDVKDGGLIEEHFKSRMRKLQLVENPRHKEFVEYLKGELKRARGILADPARRQEYDAEIVAERSDELRKILQHMLLDGKLSDNAELSVIAEGRNLGLDGQVIRNVIDEELKKSGARRVSAKSGDTDTQVLTNRKAQTYVHQIQEAKLQAKLATERARLAERHKKRAEDQVQMALHKAKEYQALARRALTAEKVSAAREQSLGQGRQVLEQRSRAAEAHVKNLMADTQQQGGKLANQAREIDTLWAQINAMEKSAGRSMRWRRLAFCYGAFLFTFVGGFLVRMFVPAGAEAVTGLVGKIPMIQPELHVPVLLAAALLMVAFGHLLAGIKKPLFLVPFLVICLAGFAVGVCA